MNKHLQQLDIDAPARPAPPVRSGGIAAASYRASAGFRLAKRGFHPALALAPLPPLVLTALILRVTHPLSQPRPLSLPQPLVAPGSRPSRAARPAPGAPDPAGLAVRRVRGLLRNGGNDGSSRRRLQLLGRILQRMLYAPANGHGNTLLQQLPVDGFADAPVTSGD